jgi:hypothetical protein
MRQVLVPILCLLVQCLYCKADGGSYIKFVVQCLYYETGTGSYAMIVDSLLIL